MTRGPWQVATARKEPQPGMHSRLSLMLEVLIYPPDIFLKFSSLTNAIFVFFLPFCVTLFLLVFILVQSWIWRRWHVWQPRVSCSNFELRCRYLAGPHIHPAILSPYMVFADDRYTSRQKKYAPIYVDSQYHLIHNTCKEECDFRRQEDQYN